MIQIGNKTADAYYVGSKLVSQIYKGSTKIYPLENQIPKSIKDSISEIARVKTNLIN